MNKKAQVYYVILGAVILLFSILMAVVLSIVDPLKTDGGLIVFLTAQVLVNAIFIVVLVYTAFSKKDIAISYIMIVSTILYQSLPIFIRLLVSGKEPSYIWSLILGFGVTLIYLGILFGSDILSNKIEKKLPELEGKRIPVKDIESYNDENNKFVGANKKEK